MLTAEALREVLDYDKDSGLFTWKKPTSLRVSIGEIAGARMAAGYISIGLYGTKHYAHRLAWLHAYGMAPSLHVDHINGVKHDNRLCNLRDVGRSTNLQNMMAKPKSSKSPLFGATFDAGRSKWTAQIKVNGKNIHLGRFETAEEAHAAYIDAKRRLHAGCTI